MDKRILLVAGIALSLGACGRGKDETPPAPAPTSTPTAAAVKFDPAFSEIAGGWVSKPDALGEGRMLRVDVASGGGYSIDVRLPGTPEQVVETGQGSATASGTTVSATPKADTKGKVLTGLGAWKATVDKAARTMVLKGADGRTVSLTWKGL